MELAATHIGTVYTTKLWYVPEAKEKILAKGIAEVSTHTIHCIVERLKRHITLKPHNYCLQALSWT